ncbi:hypothetical protein OFC04_27460, partial [Escherichia coli]|nr:hypothetical protein [Escherichia coli]
GRLEKQYFVLGLPIEIIPLHCLIVQWVTPFALVVFSDVVDGDQVVWLEGTAVANGKWIVGDGVSKGPPCAFSCAGD